MIKKSKTASERIMNGIFQKLEFETPARKK